ncbi:hypothetical protein Tco_1016770 [Tanacetum coccineum]|uniref:Uncharacterized protein n=1 Tax=Tanacetum coccineum TaxID=301880 RepID=A0ABQ5FPT2_9ASTR
MGLLTPKPNIPIPVAAVVTMEVEWYGDCWSSGGGWWCSCLVVAVRDEDDEDGGKVGWRWNGGGVTARVIAVFGCGGHDGEEMVA